MNLDFLEYFHRELEFLDSQGPLFADEYPDVGPALSRPSPETIDPHVERLIQAFAWMNARVHFHVDRDLKEISDAFFSVVLPHAQRPFPSCALVRFTSRNPQHLADGEVTVPRGTVLRSKRFQGLHCEFRTAFPVTVRAAELEEAQLRRLTEQSIPSFAPEARSVLRLTLRSPAPDLPLRLGPEPLRFFLRAPRATAFPLYELLVRDSVGIALTGPAGGRIEIPGGGLLRGAGFETEDFLLPRDARCPDGQRLLLEFFAFPEKHLFVDLFGLEQAQDLELGAGASLEVYCGRSHRELENLVSRKNFALNCTPIINLFSMRTEPVPLTHERPEYPVIADARHAGKCEIFSIDRVSAVSADGVVGVPGLFEPRAPGQARGCDAAWISQRRPGNGPGGVMQTSISVADPRGEFLALDRWTLDIEATCMNGDLPASLPFDGDGPRLSLPAEKGIDVECVLPPTHRGAPPMVEWGHGKLVAMLALQSLPYFCDDPGNPSHLREAIGLWNSGESPESRAFLECLAGAEARQVLEEVWIGADHCFARGVEVTLELDGSRSPGGSVFLFASVLERFLAMTSATNCFTRVITRSSETHQILHRFPARAGHQTLASLT